MLKEDKKLIEYMILLPHELEVEVHRAEEGGFWAKVKGYPGCVTQGENFMHLLEMINDAIFTYLEIPEKYSKKLGTYIPKLPEGLLRKARHNTIESVIESMIRNKTMTLNNYGLSKV